MPLPMPTQPCGLRTPPPHDAYACDLLYEDECDLASGCSSLGICTGEGTCPTLTTEAACDDGANCTWEAACGGTPPADCTALTARFDCVAVDGCTWAGTPGGGTCSGTPTPCAELDAAACGEQVGCTWVCAGSVTACEELDGEDACLDQGGCVWE